MNEIERKVDLLVSGIVLPKKRTRRRVATIAISLLIAMTLIAGASLITTYYYEQTATDLDVKSAITITPSGGTTQEAPWQEVVTLVGTIQAGGESYIYPEEGNYIITNNANTPTTVYIHIEVTETLSGGGAGDGLGLTVEVYNSEPTSITQFQNLIGSETFTIRVTADKEIDGTSTYGYIITMDWNPPA